MMTINGNYREFKLDNGLFVALQETPTQTVSGRLRVWHGALNEEKSEEGLAHFLEHTLMAGGSKNYGPEEADKIRGALGSFNACTGLEKTFFPIDMLDEDTELFLKYVSDAVFNPRFDVTRVEEERQRVLRETADEKSDPEFNDSRIYWEAFFGKGSPHAYLISGNEKVVKSASVEQLSGFHKRGYNPNNMDLILVGALPKNIEEMVGEQFRGFPSGTGKKFEFPRNPQLNGPTIFHMAGSELLNHENISESSAKFNLGMVAPTFSDGTNYIVGMLSTILGGDASSRLFRNVSQRKGLAYGIGTSYSVSNNKGIITIGGSVQASRAEEAIDAVFGEMKKLQTDLVPQDDLERIKKASRYGAAKMIETNEGHVNAIELKKDYGVTPEYTLRRMNEVTPEKIREAARSYFPEDRATGRYVLRLRDPLKKD